MEKYSLKVTLQSHNKALTMNKSIIFVLQISIAASNTKAIGL